MDHTQKERKRAIFVDEHRNIYQGDKALELIAGREQPSIDVHCGVIKVSRSRWLEAQRYEQRTWMEGKASTSDRNEQHAECFAKYASLRGKRFEQSIELGCGPFTNMRKVLQVCRCRNVELLDPLIDSYLSHPFCRYARRTMGGLLAKPFFPITRRGGLKNPLKFIFQKYESWVVGGLRGRPITLHNSSIEDFSPQKVYDLCVMINVLEHCRDADAVFAKILRMTAPGSYFVFADKIYSAAQEAETISRYFDAGHPLKVDYSVIRQFLDAHFVPTWDAEKNLREGDDEYRAFYYIGVRKNDPQ